MAQKIAEIIQRAFNQLAKCCNQTRLSSKAFQYSSRFYDSMIEFQNVITGNTEGIAEQVNKVRSGSIQYNRSILKTIVATVVLACGQNVALRGHRDDTQHYLCSNLGNFQAFLNYRANGGDKEIQQHFATPKKNATYRSKTIQNKLVKICGSQIKEKIVSEINSSSSPVYSVLANEATDCGTIEQMSIVLRYVDSKKEINERFISFFTLHEINLPLENCRGQGI